MRLYSSVFRPGDMPAATKYRKVLPLFNKPLQSEQFIALRANAGAKNEYVGRGQHTRPNNDSVMVKMAIAERPWRC